MLSKLIIFVFGIVSYGSFGQEYENYTTKDGLPSNQIYHTIQDSKGFMWFATNRGIAKFDGVKFKVFTTKDGLPNNDIWRLIADDKGRVWWNTKSKYQGYIENDSVYKFMNTDKTVVAKYFLKTDSNMLLISNGSYVLEKDSFRKNKFADYQQILIKSKEIFQKHNIKNPIGRNVGLDFVSKELFVSSGDKLFFYDSNHNLLSETKLNASRPREYLIEHHYVREFLPNSSFFIADRLGILLTNYNTAVRKFHKIRKKVSVSLCL